MLLKFQGITPIVSHELSRPYELGVTWSVDTPIQPDYTRAHAFSGVCFAPVCLGHTPGDCPAGVCTR
jgi:hypothetical protein